MPFTISKWQLLYVRGPSTPWGEGVRDITLSLEPLDYLTFQLNMDTSFNDFGALSIEISMLNVQFAVTYPTALILLPKQILKAQ